MSEHTSWSANGVRAVVVNPIYTGLAGYPRVISDQLWIDTARRLITDEGTEVFLRDMLVDLRKSLKYHSEPLCRRSVGPP